MAKLLLFVLLAVNLVVALLRPWIGVIVSYIFAIMAPQYIWFWAFSGIRPFLYASVPAILGFGFALVSGHIDKRPLKDKVNIWMMVLWASLCVSYFFGAYVNAPVHQLGSPSNAFSDMNKIFLFYFIAALVFSDEKKLKWALLPIFLTVIYYTYWANDMYLTGHAYGRLHGPAGLNGANIYYDQNTFAMVFVTGLPFLYYLGWSLRNKILRVLVWLIIPFGWSGVFLTGSRGGLVGLGVTALIASIRSPKKYIGLLLLPALFIAFQWQGGPIMKERADTIDAYQTNESAMGRIQAWTAGWGMIKAHPLTGVGPSSFLNAFHHFSDKQPRVAHNTIVQIAAEWGLMGGIAYLMILLLTLKTLWKNGRAMSEAVKYEKMDPLLYFINEALLVSISGFGACAMFLSLQGYEFFYYLIALSISLAWIYRDRINTSESVGLAQS